jgi:integrase
MARRKKRHGVYYRAERQRWGYQVYLRGTSYKKYAWETREEAAAALIELKKEIDSKPEEPKLPTMALIVVVNDYLADSAENVRSKWRVDGLRWNFGKVIPFFGAATPIASISTEQVRKLVIQRKRTVKPKTVWHDVTNLRALFNFACKEREVDGRKIPPLLTKNPVDDLDMSLIGNTKPKKPPLNLSAVERAAAVLNSTDRAYFDFLRFTGLRKDEANRLRWDDINFDEGWFHCRGTKTDESDEYLPLAPALIESLKKHKATTGTSDFVFPGRSNRTKGKQIYSRRRMFERIQKLTGIKLRPKDMRDIFASTVETDDARVLMALMRHTNLTTTTKYLKAHHQSMAKAVSGMGQKSLGETLGENQNALRGQKSAENSNSRVFHRRGQSGLRRGNIERKIGGGEWSRTTDAADMSRVL